MLKIGEFARICATSTQTIRFYDQAGVLKADYVDDESGYRYYKPEKLTTYQKIVEYKDAGFTLDEIKQLLSAPEAQESLFDAKREELKGEEAELKAKFERLDRLAQGEEDEIQFPPGVFPIHERLNSEFVNDPQVIGRWELVGMLNDDEDRVPIDDWTAHLDAVTGNPDELVEKQIAFKTIYFLPGGCCWWVFFWNNGVLYRMSGLFHGYCVANPYEIRTVNGENMMLIKSMLLIWKDGTPEVCNLIYRQVDNTAYSEKSARAMVDDIDLPYVPDSRALGRWTVYDFVRTIDEFDPQNRAWACEDMMYTEIVFRERGGCYRGFHNPSGRGSYRYTKGCVISQNEQTVEHYEIRTYEGVDYLFIEHKSGDYIYGGMKPHYYVFRREQPTENQDNE